MRLNAVSRWCWILAGVAAGLALGGGAVLSARSEPLGGAGFISQRAFEQALFMQSVGGKPFVRFVLIHPAGAVDLVTLEWLDGRASRYQSVRFAAPRPYIPKDGTPARGENYFVADYLKDMSRVNPAISASYAWWDEPWAMILIRTAAGALIVGGIWPLVLRLVYGPPPEPVRFDVGGGKEAEAARQPAVTDADRRHLEELGAEMMAGLASNEPAAALEQPKETVEPEIRALAGQAEEAGPVMPQDPKHYQGEYYPVEKKGGWQ